MLLRNGTLETIPRNGGVLSGLGDTYTVGDSPVIPTPSAWDNFMQQAPAFIKDLLTIKNSQDLYQTNLDRARQGLPPLTGAAVSPSVNVGLAPSARNTALTIAIIGGAALLLFKRKR